MNSETIWIGNDHGGIEMKIAFIRYLEKLDINVVNVGSDEDNIVRYPYFAARVARAVMDGECQRGILICSTGIGMSIMANKYKGVRASLCTTSYAARMTRAHNNSNLLCLGGKTTGIYEAMDILETWLNVDYEGGRHDISLGLMAEAEETLCTGTVWTPKNRNL